MNSVFFYSNYCKHCEKILSDIIKHPLRNDLHYICIDKRRTNDEGITNIILENGTEMEMPNTLKKVPTLLLINRGNKIVEGNDIMVYLNEQIGEPVRENNEPDCFSINSGSAFGVQSDSYSFYDMNADDLSAKGGGGVRQMHNYCTPMTEDNIETPPDNYVPDKIGTNGVDMDKIIQDRQKEIEKTKNI
tara:strand:+ start:1539 stop:2105 length:567 start_codon:yes stop_codon:yes gene_type:complete